MCYHMEEVNTMDSMEEEQNIYTPRPAWQVWAARVGLVIMIISVALWLWHIAYPM